MSDEYPKVIRIGKMKVTVTSEADEAHWRAAPAQPPAPVKVIEPPSDHVIYAKDRVVYAEMPKQAHQEKPAAPVSPQPMKSQPKPQPTKKH